MKPKTVLTAGLLLFALVSLAAAVADVAGLRRRDSEPAPRSTAGDGLVAYYFHTATRCDTCRAIESNAREAVAPQAEAGELDWRVVNYEEPAQQHHAREFKLLCPSVVLVQMHDGAPARWKNLERVWELFDDRAAFIEYVRAELTAFREERP